MRASPRIPAVVAFGVALVAAFSCKTFNLPNDTCDPSHFHAGTLSGNASDSTCNRCLEDHCCEQVGTCEQSTGCPELVASVHECVINAGLEGAQEEKTCAEGRKLEQKPPADDAYRCMRDSCGAECGLPVCKVDPAAVLVQTPECDGCFASSCCGELNACYGSRACKLTIECIAKECGTDLGDSLSGPAIAPADPTADAAAFDVCADGGPHAPQGPACVRKCLCEYKDNDPGLPPRDDSQRPPLLALAVYLCAQHAGCGGHCPNTLGRDAGAPSDAAAPADAAASDARADGP